MHPQLWDPPGWGPPLTSCPGEGSGVQFRVPPSPPASAQNSSERNWAKRKGQLAQLPQRGGRTLPGRETEGPQAVKVDWLSSKALFLFLGEKRPVGPQGLAT